MPTVDTLNNQLVFSFPEVHPSAILRVIFHQTLRIPDDGKKHNLPPDLGAFPIRKLDGYLDRVPAKWVPQGGVMVPVYAAEALWMSFHVENDNARGAAYPFAIRVAAGMRSALTGEAFDTEVGLGKEGDKQDYAVQPGQKWLDGFVIEGGVVRQFISAPLGEGYTAEGQLSGEEKFGGIQLQVFPMRRETFETKYPLRPPPSVSRMMRSRSGCQSKGSCGPSAAFSSGVLKSAGGMASGQSLQMESHLINDDGGAPCAGPAAGGTYSAGDIKVLSLDEAMAKRPEMYDSAAGGMEPNSGGGERSPAHIRHRRSAVLAAPKAEMGLGVGGTMDQAVFADPHGREAWAATGARLFVHLTNSLAWKIITREDPPKSPATEAMYRKVGYPFYDYYRKDVEALQGTALNQGLQSVLELGFQKILTGGEGLLPDNGVGELPGQAIVQVGDKREGQPEVQGGNVRDGAW